MNNLRDKLPELVSSPAEGIQVSSFAGRTINLTPEVSVNSGITTRLRVKLAMCDLHPNETFSNVRQSQNGLVHVQPRRSKPLDYLPLNLMILIQSLHNGLIRTWTPTLLLPYLYPAALSVLVSDLFPTHPTFRTLPTLRILTAPVLLIPQISTPHTLVQPP